MIDDTSAVALAYYEAGLAVIPILYKSKRPLVPWGQFQTTAPNRELVTTWTAKYRGANWAVILGPASGDLVAVDFDDAGSYSRWAASWPDLAQVAPTAATARGAHVYLVGPGGQRTTKLQDYAGELKGAGGYVLLPPSVHPSGAVYRWLHGDVGRYVPHVDDLFSIGIRLQARQELALPGRDFDKTRTPRLLKPCAGAILVAATAEGERNQTAWRLALHLRSEGWSEPATFHLMSGWAGRSGTPELELARTIQSAFKETRHPGHGCNSAEISPYCDRRCPLARFRSDHDATH